MDEFITQLMACEQRHYSVSQQQHQQIQYNESEGEDEQMNIPATPSSTITHTPATPSHDQDISILTETYGPLTTGMTISLDIASACELLHKERRRSDTFRRLQKKLKEKYGVELKILSRKDKKANN